VDAARLDDDVPSAKVASGPEIHMAHEAAEAALDVVDAHLAHAERDTRSIGIDLPLLRRGGGLLGMASVGRVQVAGPRGHAVLLRWTGDL